MTRVLKVGFALLLAASMWYYFDAVLDHQRKEAVLHKTLRGNLSDLYPRWLGTRELLLHGHDPYSAEVTREIQVGFYGQALDDSHLNLPKKDEERFAYPAYVVFLLAPTITVPFPILQDVFRILLILMTSASVPLWMRGLGLRFERTTTICIIFLTVGSFSVVYALYLEQLSLLVFFVIAAACAAVASERCGSAGILLAVATIKPQIAVAFVAWFGLWALGDWARRRRFVYAFASSLAVLWLGAEWILPGWFGRWWAAMHAYLGYNDARSLLETLLGRNAGLLLSAVITAGVAFLCWQSRRAPAGSCAFNVCLLSVLTADLLIKPKFPFYDGVILLPVVMWLFQCRKPLWQRSRAVRDLFFTASLLLGWQWAAAVALAAISLVSPSVAQHWRDLPVVGMLFLPVGLSCLLGVLAVNAWRDGVATLAARSQDARV